jgi:hypothetical protein
MESADPVEAYYIHYRSGFPADGSGVIVMKLDGQHDAHHNAHDWVYARTMKEAHKYIEANFHKLETGDVVDVQFILGETKQPKKSERPQ